LVNERLQVARSNCPKARKRHGADLHRLGEIFLWTVEAKEGAVKEDGTPYTPTDLRVIQDWIIKPQLRNVPGVAEINTIGGYAKEYQIAPDPKRLAAYKLTQRPGHGAGAQQRQRRRRYIERSGEQLLIRAPGRWRASRTSPTSSWPTSMARRSA
jgi:cobalt-zinc-cadmium resistance protein CzcA